MKTKSLFFILSASLLLISCGTSKKPADTLKENLARKEVLKKEVEKKALKQAQKDAKAYKKEGFRTFIGGLPMDKQIENAWLKAVDLDDAGFPEYLVVNARVIGGNTTAAKMQALHMAKVEMAGLISSNIAALIEGTTTNNDLSRQEAASLSKALQASKELIAADLGRVITELEVYRDLKNKNVEVMICLSYSSRMAYEMAKNRIIKSMDERADSLHQKLDNMMGIDKFDPKNNTNMHLED